MATFLRWAADEGYAVDGRTLKLKAPKVPQKAPHEVRQAVGPLCGQAAELRDADAAPATRWSAATWSCGCGGTAAPRA
jgi:hypothetical protein